MASDRAGKAAPLLLALLATPAFAQHTLGQVIAQAPAGAAIHVVFVHGIRVDERGSSLPLQHAMCRYIQGGCPPTVRVSTDRLDLGKRPDLAFAGQQVWKTDEEWAWSQPLVDHYVYRLPIGKTMIIDEVNWWPFTFPLKCRFVVAPDARLIGFTARTLQLCANLKPAGGGYEPAFDDHFAWIDRARFLALKRVRPPFHGAPLINRYVKSELLDWGFTEAVLALGATKTDLRETIRCAMSAVATFDPMRGREVTPTAAAPLAPPDIAQAATVSCAQPPPPVGLRTGPFVVVSHSLGSFLLLDTFAAATGEIRQLQSERSPAGSPSASGVAAHALCAPPDPATYAAATRPLPTEAPDSAGSAETKIARRRIAYRGLCFVIGHSGALYFLANQIPLLELGRIENRVNADGAVRDTLGDWARLASETHGQTPTQIVAFSDPGDALTYMAPDIPGAEVTNVAVHNATHWFNLVEDPNKAHLGYFSNPVVLETLFGDVDAGRSHPP